MMPLTPKGDKIMAAMKKEYGKEAKKVFYASRNKGTITGVDPTNIRHKKVQQLRPRYEPDKMDPDEAVVHRHVRDFWKGHEG
jgi:hypothetical protein